MDYAQAARETIRNKHDDHSALLAECAKSGNVDALRAVQLLFEDMYDRITYNFELKSPPAFCLLAWGEAGMAALVDSAVRCPEPKNLAIAITLLSHVAAGQLDALPHSYRRYADVVTIVENKLHTCDSLQQTAQSWLVNLILSIEDEELIVSAVGAQLMTAWSYSSARVRHVFNALSSRLIAVSTGLIVKYRALLTQAASEEAQLQRFLESHPQFLDPMVHQVWPKVDLNGARAPDFVLRRFDGSYVVVEIETPEKPMVTRGGQLSHEATHAVQQAIDYRDFLIRRWAQAEKFFPDFATPECLVVIGREDTLSREQAQVVRQQNESHSALKLVGFDWLATRAEVVARNVGHGAVEVSYIRMT